MQNQEKEAIMTPIFKCKHCGKRTINSFGYCDDCWQELLMQAAAPWWEVE